MIWIGKDPPRKINFYCFLLFPSFIPSLLTLSPPHFFPSFFIWFLPTSFSHLATCEFLLLCQAPEIEKQTRCGPAITECPAQQDRQAVNQTFLPRDTLQKKSLACEEIIPRGSKANLWGRGSFNKYLQTKHRLDSKLSTRNRVIKKKNCCLYPLQEKQKIIWNVKIIHCEYYSGRMWGCRII